MTSGLPTWCVAATVKAPLADIQDFAAHHLALGAKRVFLFLDDPDDNTYNALTTNPKVKVRKCDADWWASFKGKPDNHRARQAMNATRAYRVFARDIDWFIHIDVDEFLWPDTSVAKVLAAATPDEKTIRIAPVEALDGDGTAFKGQVKWNTPKGRDCLDRLYPNFGRMLRGGFISHTAGKVFARTGMKPAKVRIHNVQIGEETNPGQIKSDRMVLCHTHAATWDGFRKMFQFRMAEGSYRKELAKPNRPSMHALFQTLLEDEGEAGLRRLYDEICLDTPERRLAFGREGLLHICDLDLDTKRRTQFPG